MATDPTETNTALIERFYSAFARRDHATMAGCYGPDARFSDPVFTDLRGPEIGGMWRMLCERGTDLRLTWHGIEAGQASGSVRWEAWYTFSASGRPVHNIINARFEFADGLIQRHRDSFDLYRWARQALGLKGVLLGWAPPVQRAIRSQARRALSRFLGQ